MSGLINIRDHNPHIEPWQSRFSECRSPDSGKSPAWHKGGKICFGNKESPITEAMAEQEIEDKDSDEALKAKKKTIAT